MPRRSGSEELQRFMSAPVLTLREAQAASDAWALMRDAGVRHAVVVRGRAVVGVLSDRDLGGARGGRSRRDRTVAELMQGAPVTASPSMSVREAAALVRARRIGCLPVVERGRLVGIVTRSDLLGRLAGARERGPRARRVAEDAAPRQEVLVSPNVDKHP
jgi:acetoin utilization protein AcuB